MGSLTGQLAWSLISLIFVYTLRTKERKMLFPVNLGKKTHLFGGLEATRTFLTMSFENPGVCNSPYYICFPGNAWTLVRTYSSGSLERTWSRQGRQSNSGYRSSAACWSDACGRQWQRSICRAFRRFVCEMMENVHANTSQTRHLLVDPVERIEYTVAPKHDHVKACAPGLYATGINNNLIIWYLLSSRHIFVHALSIAENILRYLSSINFRMQIVNSSFGAPNSLPEKVHRCKGEKLNDVGRKCTRTRFSPSSVVTNLNIREIFLSSHPEFKSVRQFVKSSHQTGGAPLQSLLWIQRKSTGPSDYGTRLVRCNHKSKRARERQRSKNLDQNDPKCSANASISVHWMQCIASKGE